MLVFPVIITEGQYLRNGESKFPRTPLCLAAERGDPVAVVLLLLCFGAEIGHEVIKKAIKCDQTRILQPINDRLESLRAGNGMKTTLMSVEEKRFMWNLAFSFTIKHRVAAFKAYYAIRSFITFHGIFILFFVLNYFELQYFRK